MAPNLQLIGYIRVSRAAGREGESFISPDVQRERIEQHASPKARNAASVSGLKASATSAPAEVLKADRSPIASIGRTPRSCPSPPPQPAPLSAARFARELPLPRTGPAL